MLLPILQQKLSDIFLRKFRSWFRQTGCHIRPIQVVTLAKGQSHRVSLEQIQKLPYLAIPALNQAETSCMYFDTRTINYKPASLTLLPI